MRVAIIGAGTSGLYLSWKLAKKGHQVTIFEKNKAIGNKVCSGLFSERILDFIPEAKKLIENEINYVLIHFPKKTVRVDFSRRFLAMNHSNLDRLLLDFIRNAGVEIVLNKNVVSLPDGFDRIIGCDGFDSFVRKSLKLPNPYLRLGIQGFVNPLAGSGQGKENFVETWPCENGFLWKIPRGRPACQSLSLQATAGRQTEYGIITDLNKAYKIFNNFIKERRINLTNVKAKIVPQGLIVPNNPSTGSGQAPSTGSGQVQITLCGDAVGLTKPWSGGGVIWGLTAADLLLKSFPNFKKYSQKIKRFFLPRILISKIAIEIIYFLGFHLPWLLPKNSKIESDFLLNQGFH